MIPANLDTERVCAVCGKPFDAMTRADRLYCGMQCSQQAQTQRKRERVNAIRAKAGYDPLPTAGEPRRDGHRDRTTADGYANLLAAIRAEPEEAEEIELLPITTKQAPRNPNPTDLPPPTCLYCASKMQRGQTQCKCGRKAGLA